MVLDHGAHLAVEKAVREGYDEALDNEKNEALKENFKYYLRAQTSLKNSLRILFKKSSIPKVCLMKVLELSSLQGHGKISKDTRKQRGVFDLDLI